MLLTKHEGETFTNQTVYISGQAFLRCNFIACTLVLRETVYYMEGCSFDRCNWHLDCVLTWGSPEAHQAVQVIMDLIRQGQANLPPEGGATDAGTTEPPDSSPFA